MSEYDPTDIRSQERTRAHADTRKKLERDTDESDLKWLMGSRRGRRIVWRQLDRAGVFRLSFNTNAMAMAFAEGNRNEGLHLLAQINASCPELYLTMIRERVNGQPNDDNGHSRNDQ